MVIQGAQKRFNVQCEPTAPSIPQLQQFARLITSKASLGDTIHSLLVCVCRFFMHKWQQRSTWYHVTPPPPRYSNVAIGPYWVQYLQARGLKERRLWRADLCISVWFNRNGKADEEITLKVGGRGELNCCHTMCFSRVHYYQVTSMGPKLGPTDIRVCCIILCMSVDTSHTTTTCIATTGRAIYVQYLLCQPQSTLDVYQMVCCVVHMLHGRITTTWHTQTHSWGNAVLQPRYARKVLDPKVPDWDPVKITGQPLFKSCLPWIVVCVTQYTQAW